MDAGAEIERLESNHAELLLHQETLAAQLQTKKEQLKHIRAALRDCRALLVSLDEAQRQATSHSAVHATEEESGMSDVVMATS